MADRGPLARSNVTRVRVSSTHDKAAGSYLDERSIPANRARKDCIQSIASNAKRVSCQKDPAVAFQGANAQDTGVMLTDVQISVTKKFNVRVSPATVVPEFNVAPITVTRCALGDKYGIACRGVSVKSKKGKAGRILHAAGYGDCAVGGGRVAAESSGGVSITNRRAAVDGDIATCRR